MKKKLIEILERNLDYKPHIITGIEKCAEEIIKEQSKVTLDDIYEFYEFLQGRDESGIKWENRKGLPKLSAEQAFQVIYYLQEHLRVLPDSIERCNICGELFDYETEGLHDDKGTGKFYCDNCR